MMTLERAEEILKSLDIANKYDEEDVQEEIEKQGIQNEVSCVGGISKICLMFKDANFVFKYSNPYAYSDGNEAEREVDNYNRAVELGLEMFFPKTYLYSKIDGINIIYQEKIDYNADEVWKDSKLFLTIHDLTCDHIDVKRIASIKERFNIEGAPYNRDINTTWIAFMCALYTTEVIDKLIDFIQEKKINDLHGENLGYKNNKPIILDFSGYYC